jgi:hypothetical protein
LRSQLFSHQPLNNSYGAALFLAAPSLLLSPDAAWIECINHPRSDEHPNAIYYIDEALANL